MDFSCFLLSIMWDIFAVSCLGLLMLWLGFMLLYWCITVWELCSIIHRSHDGKSGAAAPS